MDWEDTTFAITPYFRYAGNTFMIDQDYYEDCEDLREFDRTAVEFFRKASEENPAYWSD